MLALVAIVAFNASIYFKAATLQGLVALLASPGLGWTVPLALTLLLATGGR